MRVGFEVVKLFVAEVNVTGVFEAGGAQGLGLWDCSVLEEVLVKEVCSPFWSSACQQWDEAPALHLWWWIQAGELEDCRCDVDVEDKVVASQAAKFLRRSGVVNSKRDADGFLVRKPFSGEAVLAEVKAVVAGEE